MKMFETGGRRSLIMVLRGLETFGSMYVCRTLIDEVTIVLL